MSLKKLLSKQTIKKVAVASLALIGLAHLYILSFAFLPAPQTWTMTGRVMEGETLSQQRVDLEDISPYLIAAVIAAEDARFCSHHGIDREAIEKAIEHNKKGGRRRGGSTITQQTAKNLFFWNGGGMVRKAGEAYVALLIDAAWPKSTIMQHYLNIAEWGDGIFGAEAAAQARFGKSASALTSYEAALLASVLPSPNKWRLDPPSEFVGARARTINARLKVTAREGFGDCVLSLHPAYKRANFGVVRPEATKDKLAPKSENLSKDTSLEDILTQAEVATKTARLEEGEVAESSKDSFVPKNSEPRETGIQTAPPADD
jgi:monofunctional biosynthetic peptidoglycan transglycosylase